MCICAYERVNVNACLSACVRTCVRYLSNMRPLLLHKYFFPLLVYGKRGKEMRMTEAEEEKDRH